MAGVYYYELKSVLFLQLHNSLEIFSKEKLGSAILLFKDQDVSFLSLSNPESLRVFTKKTLLIFVSMAREMKAKRHRIQGGF